MLHSWLRICEPSHGKIGKPMTKPVCAAAGLGVSCNLGLTPCLGGHSPLLMKRHEVGSNVDQVLLAQVPEAKPAQRN